MGAAGTQCSRVLITLTEAPAKVVFARSVSLVKIKPSQRFHKENKMRILLALIAVFMVSGAVAIEEDRPTGGDQDLNDLVLNARCQFRSAGASGPIYACRDLKTGKVVSIECKVPPNKAQMMPREMSFTELADVCSLRSDNRF